MCNFKVGFLLIQGFVCTFVNDRSKTMVTKEQVESFLAELHTKMKIFGIIFRDDRGKNRETLQRVRW